MVSLHEYVNAIPSPSPIFEQFEIDVSRINNQYMLEEMEVKESFDVDIYDETTDPSGEQKKESGFGAWISKMAQRVARLFQDFAEMIRNMFSVKGHVNLDNFKETELGKRQINYDINMVQSSVDAEIRKGRKLIQAISHATKIDDAAVESFVDGCATAIKRFAVPTLITGGSIALFKGWENRQKAQSSEMNGAAQDMRAAEGDKNKENAVMRIYSAMTNMVNEGCKAFGTLAKNIQQANK